MSSENTQWVALKEKAVALKDKFTAADKEMKTKMLASVFCILVGLYFSFAVLSSGFMFLIKVFMMVAVGWLFYQYCIPFIKSSLAYVKQKPTPEPVAPEIDTKE